MWSKSFSLKYIYFSAYFITTVNISIECLCKKSFFSKVMQNDKLLCANLDAKLENEAELENYAFH